MSDEKTIVEEIQEELPDAQIVKREQVIEGEVTEIVPMSLHSMRTIYNRMKKFVQSELREDTDFGEIPGTGSKPSLYKPGAEKLQRFFGLSAQTDLAHATEKWETPIDENAGSFPLFHYRYTTTVYDSNGKLVTTCDGECNSFESKYKWRWVQEHQVPEWVDKANLEKRTREETEFKFAIDAAKTTGEYAKPQSYWDSWNADIESGVAKPIKKKARSGKEYDAFQRGGVFYRIFNRDIHSQVNTIMKMSQKRAYVGAIIIAANASEFFTQDLEDKVEEREQKKSIRDFVPNKVLAAKALVKHISSLGIENAGDWIKEVLEANNIDFTLDMWNEILNVLEKQAAV